MAYRCVTPDGAILPGTPSIVVTATSPAEDTTASTSSEPEETAAETAGPVATREVFVPFTVEGRGETEPVAANELDDGTDNPGVADAIAGWSFPSPQRPLPIRNALHLGTALDVKVSILVAAENNKAPAAATL